MKNNIARQIPARGANHYVRAVVLQNLLILCNGKTSKEHSDLKISLDPIALNLFSKMNIALGQRVFSTVSNDWAIETPAKATWPLI